MIDIEIHGTGGRTAESRSVLLRATREALAEASYGDQLTLVDTGSEVFNIQKVQSMPFDRIYAPGEREALNQEAYAREGIPLNAVTRADLREVAGSLQIPMPVWQT